MKKTIQIHIGGRQFHINEDAFERLTDYLNSLKRYFAHEGESGKEIIEDIEQRIAELFENKISADKQAIILEDAEEVISILGKIEDFEYKAEPADGHDRDSYEQRTSRRFFRDPDNNYLGGVAAGLGAYFDIDPLWLRLAFVALCFLSGLGVIIYIILWVVVPKAGNTAEKLQMQGMPVTLANIKESVNAEYSKVRSGLSAAGNSDGFRKLGDLLEKLFRLFALVIVGICKFIIGLIGILLIIAGSVFLVALLLVLLGQANLFTGFNLWNGQYLSALSEMFSGSSHFALFMTALLILVIVPVITLIYGGIKIIFNIRTRHRVLRAFALTAWILALILFISILIVYGSNYALEASASDASRIQCKPNTAIYLDIMDNDEQKKIVNFSVFGYEFTYSESDENLYKRPYLALACTSDSVMMLSVEKFARNVGSRNSGKYLDEIQYNWEQQDSVLVLDEYFKTSENNFWMFAEVKLTLHIPENHIIVFSEETCDLFGASARNRYCRDSLLAGKPAIMTPDGLTLLRDMDD